MTRYIHEKVGASLAADPWLEPLGRAKLEG
jgi:hypothetical protein